MKTFTAFLFAAAMCPAFADQPRILFDTDITGDVDDVLALAMCHSLADRGTCEFIGVTVSKNNPLTGPFVDAINTFYGRPDLPIGVTRDEKAQHRESKYLKLASEYPHDLLRNEDAREAVDLTRELLAASPDGSVTIVSVGIASNLAALLDSKADGHSSLDGPALIRKKVKTLSIMAGAFTFANGTNRHLEANVINGVDSMRTVAERWPEEVPVLWSGYEIGENLPYPRLSIAQDFNWMEKHPVRESYLLHSGPEHDRPCWDESSVLIAAFPERGYFGLSAPGKVEVEEDGFTIFRPQGRNGIKSGRDRFLTMTPTQQARALEAIVQLTAQRPRASSVHKSGFVPIHDGASFAGWEQSGNWEVVDGAFHRKSKGGPLTYTAAAVPDDFELRFEWKVSTGCNSGLYYRPGQVEYQVLDNVGSPYGENARQAAASLFFCMAPSKDATKGVGEWNTARVICQGTVIEHWLNEERVLSFDYTDPKWKWYVDLLSARGGDLTGRGGHLWLQDHGQEVWFRNLRWRELSGEVTIVPDPAFEPMPVTGVALEKEEERVRKMLEARKKPDQEP